MASTFAPLASSGNGAGAAAAASSLIYSITALKRWSSSDKSLPDVNRIKHIHIYDFDNTLFASPLPNQLIWSSDAIGKLQKPDPFVNGGWWHDDTILASTGEGVDKEEPRAWQGWWNEDVVVSARRSAGQKDILAVLLTGRAERNFSELVLRMVRSKGLKFDMVCLKPQVTPANQRVKSTMDFKTQLIRTILLTYTRADKIKIWEDRPHHIRQFRRVIEEFNRAVQSRQYPVNRPRVWYDLVEVKSLVTSLDQVAEIAEVQRIINLHNQAVVAGKGAEGLHAWKMIQAVAYTAYHVTSDEDRRVLSRLADVPKDSRQKDIVYHSTHAVVQIGALSPDQLISLGGLNSVVRFRVTHVGSHNAGLWAAKVEPVEATTRVSLNSEALRVVLACHAGVRPSQEAEISGWQPITDQMIEFDAELRERIFLDLQQECASAKPETHPAPHPAPPPPPPPLTIPIRDLGLNANRKRPREESSSSEGQVTDPAEAAEYIALDFDEPDQYAGPRYAGGRNNNNYQRGYRPPAAISGPMAAERANRGHQQRGRGGRRGDLSGGRGGYKVDGRDDRLRGRGGGAGGGGGGGGRGGGRNRGGGGGGGHGGYGGYGARDGYEDDRERRMPYRDNRGHGHGHGHGYGHGHGHGHGHNRSGYQDLDAAYQMEGAGELRDEGLYDAY